MNDELSHNGLCASRLSVTAGDATLLQDASLSLLPGELVVILGPNGAGKTSLVRALLGMEPDATGEVTIDGERLTDLTPVQRARRVAYLPQLRPLAWPARVRDVVSLGRYAYGAASGRLRSEDAVAVDEALKDCDLWDLRNRSCRTLSGGELARMHCARAFAAKTPLLIADEPIASLDPSQVFRIMNLFERYVDRGAGALLILHDIDIAARYADRLIFMKDSRIIDNGPTESVLNAELIEKIYGVKANVSDRRVSVEKLSDS